MTGELARIYARSDDVFTVGSGVLLRTSATLRSSPTLRTSGGVTTTGGGVLLIDSKVSDASVDHSDGLGNVTSSSFPLLPYPG